jgi:hypothetical protein
MKQYFFGKRFLLIVFLVHIKLCAIAQNQPYSSKSLEFQEQYDEFRYSLYSKMQSINSYSLGDFFVKLDSVYPAFQEDVKKFITDNQSVIKEYQLEIFQYYSKRELPDLGKFSLDTTLVYESMEWGGLSEPIKLLMGIEPLSLLNFQISQMMSRLYGVTEMGERVLKNAVARPRIITKKSSKNHWTVYFDMYEVLHQFEYRLDTQESIELKIYRRLN